MQQHHSVTLIPKADKIGAARDLLEQCAARVAARKAEGGPASWSAAFDAETGRFYVEAAFQNSAAVAFHQANIEDLVRQFGSMMAARPETIVRPVFSLVA